MGKTNKTLTLKVRVTEGDMQVFQTAADSAKLTLSAWTRDRLLTAANDVPGVSRETEREPVAQVIEPASIPALNSVQTDNLPSDFVGDLVKDWARKLGIQQGADESDEEFREVVTEAVRVESETGNAEASQAMSMIGSA